MKAAEVRVDELTVRYGHFTALSELTVTIPANVTAKATVLKLVVSTPGAGKSSEINVNVSAAAAPP